MDFIGHVKEPLFTAADKIMPLVVLTFFQTLQSAVK